MNVDEYNEVFNGSETYEGIASILGFDSCLVGWTDGHGSHHDILFTLSPSRAGALRSGFATQGRSLFVSIANGATFGFDVDRAGPLHPSYVAEKLGLGENQTTDALTELINGVIDQMLMPNVPQASLRPTTTRPIKKATTKASKTPRRVRRKW